MIGGYSMNVRILSKNNQSLAQENAVLRNEVNTLKELPSSNRVNSQALKTKFPSVAHLIYAELSGSLHSVPLSVTLFYPNIINLSEPEASTIWLLSEVLPASFAILFLLFLKRTDLIFLILQKNLDFFILGLDFL